MYNNNNSSKIKNLVIDGYCIPVAAAIGIVPLITGIYSYTNDVLIKYPWFLPSSYSSTDIFLAYKSFALQILMAVMVFAYIYSLFKPGKKPFPDKPFILLVPYLFWVILSGICAVYPGLSFGVSYDRFEPVGAVISYAVICVYSYLFVNSDDRFKKVICYIAVFYAVMIGIGVMQGLGHDPFSTEAVRRLLTFGADDTARQITVMRYAKAAYCTLYNENYTGMYLSVLLPVCVMIVSLPLNIKIRIAAGILALASLFVLYRSGSESGWIALTVSSLAVFLFRMIHKRRYLYAAAAAAIFIAGILTVFIIPSLRERLSERITGGSQSRPGSITGIETKDDEAVFHYLSGSELHCRFDFTDDGKIRPEFWDKNGNELKASYSDGVYRLEECFEYSDAAVKGQPTKQPGIFIASFVIDGQQWPLTNCTDGTYYYVTSGLNLVKFPVIESAGIFPDDLLSGRGAIWNRCIPLLKKHLLLGCGPNLFIIDYQQDDYILKTYSVGWGKYVYDVKPHSFYICTWMESGFSALLCIIAFFLYYIVNGVRLYLSIDLNDKALMFGARVGLGMFVGCIAYMTAALANDSTVCTAPVFWAVLGMSFAVNKRLSL